MAWIVVKYFLGVAVVVLVSEFARWNDNLGELLTTQDKAGTAFFELKEAELEVSFVLDAKASTEGQLLVAQLGGETKATQTVAEAQRCPFETVTQQPPK